MTKAYTPQKEALRWVALLVVTLVVSALFVGMVQPFLVALFLAAITTAMSAKLQDRTMRATAGRKPLAAILTLSLLMVTVIAPLVFVAWLAADQAQAISETASGWIDELSRIESGAPLPDWVPLQDTFGDLSAEITSKFGELASAIGRFAVSALGEITRGTASFFLAFFVFIYALFIFLQMDRPIIDLLLSYSGLAPETQAALRDRMISVSRATLKGTLLIGVAQGALGGVGFWAAGIDGAAFWGVVMAVLSVIPGVGPLFIIFCGVIWLFTQGMITPAVGLAVWGMAVVGTIDNVLRPILVGRDAALNDVLILISTLGGLAMFGAAGLVIGPVLAGLFVTLWDTLATDRLQSPEVAPPDLAEDTPTEDVLDEELASDLLELRERKAQRNKQQDT